MSVEVVVLLRWHNILVQLNDALHRLYKASAVASLFFFVKCSTTFYAYSVFTAPCQLNGSDTHSSTFPTYAFAFW